MSSGRRGPYPYAVIPQQTGTLAGNTDDSQGESENMDVSVVAAVILQTHASNGALGTVLSQEVNRVTCPVAYGSQKLKPQERRYGTVEHKCLTIKWGVNYFCYVVSSPW